MIKSNNIVTARSYNGKKELHFKDINNRFHTLVETNHKRRGNGFNDLSVYILAIRAIYNKAKKAGLVEKELHPFDDYKIKTTPKEKRALDAGLIKKIIQEKIESGDICFDARNYFLAS